MLETVVPLRRKSPETPAADVAPPAVAPASGATRLVAGRLHKVVQAIAEAAVPPGRFLAGAGAETAERLVRWLDEVPPASAHALRVAYLATEVGTVATHGRPFSSLSIESRAEILRGWEQSHSHAVRALLRALLTPIKFEHFDRPEMFEHVGCRYDIAPGRDEKPRWLPQVTDGRSVDSDLELECEVVVVGTGAGGAAAAYELAARGRAVLLLEEGDYHRRSTFTGRPSRAYRQLYRDRAMTVALGNVGIPIWAGRAVGGSTVINSGTCYRAPERTLTSWREKLGLPAEFSSEGLGPYYARVEAMLGVAPAERKHTGAIGDIVARGADRLGLSHGVLPRNAPGCDGQGVCCFGCPTGAKRSTDVSYVPAALERGAQLVTAARVDTVTLEGGRARGVVATLAGPGGKNQRRPKLTVRAEAVVVAGGTLMTPLLLDKSGACRSSGMLGKNLSIHPASKVYALMDERVDQWNAIPQGYCVDHYAEEGLMFEGGSLPFDVAALGVPWTGPRFVELMEQYPHLATFGFMIQDESRGSVRRGPGGSPLIFYNLNAADMRKMQRGVELLCQLFQAAGARRVLPLVAGHDEVTDRQALERLRASTLTPGDIEVTAFHPLGTCRVGTDPRTSCIGPDHEAHDVAGLYVCDGSAIPSSLGVNPQMTIMAMALRSAERIDARLS